MLLQIDLNLQFKPRIKQLKIYSIIYIEINYDSAAFNWLLLISKSSNWGTQIYKTEIKNLKIENWCIDFIDVWIFVWCWILLVECIWLKYQRSMLTEIKTTLKLSHQSFLQPKLWSVATPWPLVLPRQLTDTVL